MAHKKQGMTGEVYSPSPEIVTNADVNSYEETAHPADNDWQGFWGARAQGALEGDITTLEE
jgi:hypothetical protein